MQFHQWMGPIAPRTPPPTAPQANEPYTCVPRSVPQQLSQQSALSHFRVIWPDSTTADKGRTSLGDIRNNPSHSEVPVFGFQTARHYDNFPVLAPTLRAMNQVGGYGYAPSGQSPLRLVLAREITYDGVMYIEQILRCPTHGSYLTNYGLYLDLPVLRSKMFCTSGCCSSECRITSPTRARL